MFFESWWQGILFGIVTTVGLAAIYWIYALNWKKTYEGQDDNQPQSCDAHH